FISNLYMRILITGGAGFIGSNIAEKISKQHEVIVFDDLSTGKIENISEFKNRMKFINGNILNENALNKAMKNVDFVLHQAAIPSVPKSIKDPIGTSKVNIIGTLNVLECARKNNVKRVILASSSSVYGDKPTLPKVESMCPEPKSPYASAKVINEQHAKQFYEFYGLETISLRYFNVYGKRQDPKSEYAAVIPAFISRMLKNKPPIIYGDGKQTRDFTYIDDVVDANIRAMETKNKNAFGRAVNIAGGKQISILELAALLNKILCKNLAPVFEKERPGDVKHSLADISLAKQLLNWEPKTGLEEGLRRTVEWYKGR
ncbi:MAG: SDR family oxidoreductase, partial [Candidatus Anstonellales archaeon]